MKAKKNIKIYCFYYRDTSIPISNELYCPVMAGKSMIKSNLNIPGDDTGDNISDKNYFYSELTGIYWVWKNTVQDITGSCHYRRYFTAKDEPVDFKLKRKLFYLAGLYKKRYGLIYTGNISRFKKYILNKKEIKELLKNYDAILPQPRRLKYSVEKHYNRYHNSEDLGIIKQIILDKYPEYLPSFSKVLQEKKLYANNMFILPDERFQKFMDWWFSILFEFERRINPDDYKGYQQRIVGFIAERLLTIWFQHEKLKVKELPVVYFKKLKYRRGGER